MAQNKPAGQNTKTIGRDELAHALRVLNPALSAEQSNENAETMIRSLIEKEQNRQFPNRAFIMAVAVLIIIGSLFLARLLHWY